MFIYILIPFKSEWKWFFPKLDTVNSPSRQHFVLLISHFRPFSGLRCTYIFCSHARFLPPFVMKWSRPSAYCNISDFPWDFFHCPWFATLHSLLLFIPRFLALSSKLHCTCVLLFCVCFLAVHRDLTNLNDLIIVTFKVDRRVWVLINLLEKALSYM